MIDVRDPEHVLATIENASRRFEKGGPVPNATRQVLVELCDAVGESGPLELGISARQWLQAQDRLKRAVESLRDDRVEVQVREAEKGLRAARGAFRLAAWSARWRGWFGESRSALRIQFAAIGLVTVVTGAVLESAFQPGSFHPIFLAVGPVLLAVAWLAIFQDTTARLGDARLARDAARHIADGQRALLALRLVSDGPQSDVELAIATDQLVLAAWRDRRGPWAVKWSIPYTQLSSFSSDEKAEPPRLTLRTVEGARVLECHGISSQSGDRDYQGKLREALLTIVDGRARPRQGRSREPESGGRRDPAQSG